MAIRAVPIISDRIFLREISDEVAKLEGDCKKDERAWVIVRQATEADNRERSARYSSSTLMWTDDGVQENRTDNVRERWAHEVFLVLCDAGNILDAKGGPLFKFHKRGDFNAVDGGFQDFLDSYGRLNSVVATAILRAVYSSNPDWDWMNPTGEADDGAQSD